MLFHTTARLLLIFVHLVLSLSAVFFLTKSFQQEKSKTNPYLKAFLIVGLLSLEPFFLGNSRLLHLDILLSLFLFNGLLVTYLAYKQKTWYYFVLSGFFMSLSFLTKSIGIGGILFALGFSFYRIILEKDYKIMFQKLFLLFVSFFISTFMFFPALWVAPVETILSIFDEAARVGVRKGHGQIFFGQYTRDPGVLFYLFVFVIKASPFILFGALANLVLSIRDFSLKKNMRSTSLEFFLLVFYVGYLVVMILPTKKLDRYMLPIFPVLALYAVNGYYVLFDYLKSKNLKISISKYIGSVVVLFTLFLVVPLVTVFPYYFTYTSPLVGTSVNANNIIAQKSFGVGIGELKEHIFSNYGEYPLLGFIDTKPMNAIYPNSKIYDIREAGTRRYDLLILGINEELPENVLESGTKFNYSSSVYINGLEYWRIFVKDIKEN
jgi:hypothetical protein